MQRILLCTLFAIILSALHLPAQTTGTLEGRVLDESGYPVPGATVLVLATSRGAATDVNGMFCIAGLSPGSYTIRVTSVGCSDTLVSLTTIVAAQATIENFAFTLPGEGEQGVVNRPRRIKKVDGMVTICPRVSDSAGVLESTHTSMFSSIARPARVKSADGGFNIRRPGSVRIRRDGFEITDPNPQGETGAVRPLRPSPYTSDRERLSELSSYGGKIENKSEKSGTAEHSLPSIAPNQLTAGEWCVLEEWNFWTSLITSNEWASVKTYWGMGNGERISVRVDNGSSPIPDAVVQLFGNDGSLLWTARSDNFGRAELFTGFDADVDEAPCDILVSSGGKEVRLKNVDPAREGKEYGDPLVVRMRGDVPELKTIDLMFAIDATGSMADELRYIRAELESVIRRVKEKLGDEEVILRISITLYRDYGDEFLVYSTEFTGNVEEIITFLRAQKAEGGGDWPEAVDQALRNAIRDHHWSPEAQSRFLFLVLDAPPHYNVNDLNLIRQMTREAAAKGIRIIPVASSGVSKETEFLLRMLGLHTGGTYVFLTDHSDIGASHVESTIGGYAVEFLDDLLVRLIVQYTSPPESLDNISSRKPEIR